MRSKINIFLEKWLEFISVPYNFLNVCASLLLLKVSYETAKIAGIFATKNASNPVNDIVFLHVPYVDTSFIHGDISFFLYDCRSVLFILFIQYTPFGAKALAAIIFLRSIFINLTQLGIPEGVVPINSYITFGGDLFFSGHVANMVMLGLIFWNIAIMRYFFMGMAFVFGVSAVLGHYHYTIDVLSAPFFAYGTFIICKKIFYKEYLLTVDKLN